MGNTVRLEEIHSMTVDEFLATGQIAFGSAWRYELVDGLPVAQAAPSDEHAMISANLAAALTHRLRGNRDGSVRSRASPPDVVAPPHP
jgi:Uma2 family endonuclease